MNKLNPGELEVDLLCKGMRIDQSATLEQDGRPLSQMRAGLGSGLEIVIPGKLKNVWANVPVREIFAKSSPYILAKRDDGYVVIHEPENLVYPVIILPQPKWYQMKTSSGVPMSRIGILQGTYLGIYIGPVCGFWTSSPQQKCRFCTTGLNVGVSDAPEKNVEDVVEVAHAAKEESKITFVHFNSGYQNGNGLDIAAPYVKAIKEKVGALVGLQVIPSHELSKYDRLIDLGVNHFSFCYELHNKEFFTRYLPGKASLVGQETFFKALEYTSKKLGKGAVSGEIIAGIEPISETLSAIDYITSAGAFPTVCIFRPVSGSEMENFPSPPTEDMMTVMRHVYEACRKNKIPIGMAPNIEVSIIVNPTDTLYLAPHDVSWYVYRFKLWILRTLAKPYFALKMRRRK